MEQQYFKRIDFLRAIAVLIVLLSHWIKECGLTVIKPLGTYGVYGVNLFFVISGFLITRNLYISSGLSPFKTVIKAFFIKRILRLFPAYYLLLIFLFLSQKILHFWVVYDYADLLWYIFYIPNFFNYWHGWPYPSISHAWTLAVEEQFYLIWPFIIILFRNNLKITFIILILFGLYFISLFNDIDTAKLFPMGNFSYLAGGSFLALVEHKLKLKQSVLYLSLMIIILIIFKFNVIFTDLIIAINFILIVNIFCKKLPNSIDFIVTNKYILYIGKISYGIYLYHRFIPHFIYSVIHKLHININDWIIFVSMFFIVYFIAHISYKYYESYFLNIKKRIH